MSRTQLRILLCIATLILHAACGESPRAPQSGSESARVGEKAETAAEAQPMTGQIVGVAMYRERMALPADANFEATLEDVSRADAPAQVIGRARMEPAGEPPFRFSISYDPSQLQPGHKYAVRARVTRAGQLLFTTDRHYGLPPGGQELEMMLVRAQQQTTEPASTARLENTYWKLIRLGSDPVTVGAQQREPHLVLHSTDSRVAGFGGCSRLVGSYFLSGEKLTFSQMAGTMMACPEGMEQERALHDALVQVSGWRIVGETLELFDDVGTTVALFESRYMQ